MASRWCINQASGEINVTSHPSVYNRIMLWWWSSAIITISSVESTLFLHDYADCFDPFVSYSAVARISSSWWWNTYGTPGSRLGRATFSGSIPAQETTSGHFVYLCSALCLNSPGILLNSKTHGQWLIKLATDWIKHHSNMMCRLSNLWTIGTNKL